MNLMNREKRNCWIIFLSYSTWLVAICVAFLFDRINIVCAIVATILLFVNCLFFVAANIPESPEGFSRSLSKEKIKWSKIDRFEIILAIFGPFFLIFFAYLFGKAIQFSLSITWKQRNLNSK